MPARSISVHPEPEPVLSPAIGGSRREGRHAAARKSAQPPAVAAPQQARFFKSAAEFRHWLARNGERETELWVGIYRKSSGKQGISYEDAVRQALCFGWIDGVRMSAGEDGSAQRFSPRKRRSTWSALNLKRFAEMRALGQVDATGMRAYERRNPATDGYAIADRRNATLGDEYEQRFAEHPNAWVFYQAQPPWYRRDTAYWVTSAKREETRDRRFATLVADAAAGRRVGVLDSQSQRQTPRPEQRAV
jgi:uncharacterized protein YdeI (YjbR/CyaY-like superfamily)